MKLLAKCSNMFGSFSHEAKKAIMAYVDNPRPTTDDWDNIKGYIIDGTGKMTTVWQAVIEQDPSFPKSGRIEDEKGNVIKDWARIPTGLEVARAIKNHFSK